MIPSKPKKDESRRSSILKACKPRQPLQNVNLNSSSNESSPATSKIKRRVSFADKKHVKKFCDSAVQGTVWDRTYEEHDSSFRESFEADQGTKVESKESVSKVASENDCINTGIETSSNCINSCQLRASSVNVYEDDKNDLDLTTPVEHVELFSQQLPFRQTILSNLSKSTIPSTVTTGCTDNYKKNCASVIDNEYHSKTHTSKVHPELDKTCIQDLSMEFTGVIPVPLVPMYRDSEDEQKDVQKDHIASHQDNFDTNCSTMKMTEVISWRNKVDVSDPTSKQRENVSYGRRDSITFSKRTKLLHNSMEFTEAVLSHHNRIYNNIENATKSLISNVDNESITEASMSVKPIQSDLEVVKKVPAIVHNRKGTRHDAASTIFPANLQSTKSIAFSRIQNADCGAMELTNVVRSLVTDTDTFDRNSNGNDADFNTSMEITFASPFKLYEEDTTHSCNKSTAKEDNLRKSWKVTEDTDKTQFFNDIPMEMTRPVSIYERDNSRLNDENTVAGKDLPKNRETNKNSDETEFFHDAPMQITRLINAVLPVNVHDKENLKIDEPMFENHKNMFSDNTSMEITKAVSSRSNEEMFDPIAHEKNSLKSNSYVTHSEKTKLLCKSMDITEAVACPVLREKTCGIESTVESTEALLSRTPAAPRPSLPGSNSAGSSFHTDPVVNNDRTIDDVPMEMTAAVQSTTRRTEYLRLNGTENLGVFGSNKFQCSTANNAAEPKRNETRENITIPREPVTDPHDASSDARVLTDHFDRSLSATSGNVNKKKSTQENEDASAKRFRSDSLVESQLPVCRSAHSSFRADDKCISVKCLTEDAIDPAQILALPCELNVSDGLNKTDECSFLKKHLENSLVELQSINPPSFVYMSSQEENSLLEGLREDELHASIITDVATINDKDNNPGRLEPTNVEHDETKDCRRNVVMNAIKDNRGTEAIERTIVDDNQIDESNRCATDVEHLDGESASSTSNVSRRNMVTLSSTDRFAETKVTREDRVDEERYTRREINDEVELRNIEERERRSGAGEEVERCCIDHLKEAKAAIKDQVDRSEYRRENSNGETNPQVVEELKDCVEKKVDAEQRVNGIEEEPLVERDPFLSLAQKVETHAEGKDCIWNVYYKNVDRKIIAFGFMSNSLLIVTFFDDPNHSEENSIEKIKIVSRIADDADVLMRIAHGLILEKINVGTLNTRSYRTHEDVFPMLDLVSQDVRLAMDFMFDLRRLDNLNLMQIARDKISFVSRSKHMDIILEITINVKRFDKLTPSDIRVRCLLGAIRETEIKNLIKSVKKDHKFLRRYMNDVRDYIDIIEEISPTSS